MPTYDYDLIIIGGSIDGSPLTAIADLPQRIAPYPRARYPNNPKCAAMRQNDTVSETYIKDKKPCQSAITT